MRDAADLLPDLLVEKLSAFCAASKTGSLELDFKDGRVQAYKLTEAGRVDNGKRPTNTKR